MSDKKFNFDPNHLSDQMKESAQQIWLAGLGAFAKNQQEGKKVFDKLVEDGMNLQKKILNMQDLQEETMRHLKIKIR